TEAHFGKDQADYQRWNNAREWFESSNLWKKPIVRHDFDDSSEFDGNAYNKAGWVLYMLRHQIGEDVFYRGIKHYLEVNRGKNVVTSDLAKAIEEATHTNVDQFFSRSEERRVGKECRSGERPGYADKKYRRKKMI